MTEFLLPEQKLLATGCLDSWCRELTDLTGLAFAVWNAKGQFWVPAGFSTTLTGLVVGAESLRQVMRGLVNAVFDDGQVITTALCPGLACLAVPLYRRGRTVFVVSAIVRTSSENLVEGLAFLAAGANVSREEVQRRLSGETFVEPVILHMVAGITARFGAEYIQRLDAEEEVEDVSRKLSEGYEEITLYQRMATKVRVSQPSDAFFMAMCSELLEFLEVEGLAALYRESTDERSEPRVVTMGDSPLSSPQLLRLYRHFESDLMDGREVIIVNECQESPEIKELAPGVRNMILVPLRQGRRLYGVIAAFNKNDGLEFYSTDVKLVASVSGTIAVFVENSHLYADLHRLMLGAIKALVSSIDAKDEYTYGHSERVALISKQIAGRMGLPAEDVDRIYLTGLLHDIGKIGIPERILLKNGRLEPEEFNVIKTHPTIGARILAGVRELEAVIPGVLHHHERPDGRGYPKGLDDSNMPLEGRIIGLADALDAMTSNRVYRGALALDKVEAEIRRCSGTQFDIRCVDALLELGLEKVLALGPEQQGAVALERVAGSFRR